MSPEKQSPKDRTIPIFPLMRKLTGLKLRHATEMDYVLSLVMDSQPQINLIGQYGDRIVREQAELVDKGIKEANQKLEDLKSLIRSIPEPTHEKLEHDWER